MDAYRTEEEQVEAIKRWWDENGKGLVAAVVLAAVSVSGYKFWQSQKIETASAASAMYQQLVDVASNSRMADLNETDRATAGHLVAQLQTDFKGTEYARLASLINAKLAVINGNLPLAIDQLKWAADNGADEQMQKLINLRLAKVYFAQKEFDKALSALGGDAGTLAPAYEELRGDILYAQDKKSEARLAYQKASDLYLASETTRPSPILDMKLEHLAAFAPQTEADVEVASVEEGQN